MTTPIVEMRGISKRYGGVQALDGAGLDIYAGEVHALVGDNAAGASVSLAYPFGSPLAVVRHGVRTFVDWGAVYDAGTKLADARYAEARRIYAVLGIGRDAAAESSAGK